MISKILSRIRFPRTGKFWLALRDFLTKDSFGMSYLDKKRLAHYPRHYHTNAPLLGRRMKLTDPFWYLWCYREIFSGEIYKFSANRTDPLIIDCGANIGMSVVYFKHLYPYARIIAFEPDKEIVEVLQTNLKTFQLKDVTVYPKAVWTSDTQVHFNPDGGVGGRIEDGIPSSKSIQVETSRLNDFLDRSVDFLKIDIEGAEYEVIKDCRDKLKNVGHIFVEYHGRYDEKQTLHELLQMLQVAGFRYHLKEANPIQHPFIENERNKHYDLQMNIFGFRE